MALSINIIKSLNTFAVVLISGMLAIGCGRVDEITHKKKSKKANETTIATSAEKESKDDASDKAAEEGEGQDAGKAANLVVAKDGDIEKFKCTAKKDGVKIEVRSSGKVFICDGVLTEWKRFDKSEVESYSGIWVSECKKTADRFDSKKVNSERTTVSIGLATNEMYVYDEEFTDDACSISSTSFRHNYSIEAADDGRLTVRVVDERDVINVAVFIKGNEISLTGGRRHFDFIGTRKI